jgi:hypothetical protein
MSDWPRVSSPELHTFAGRINFFDTGNCGLNSVFKWRLKRLSNKKLKLNTKCNVIKICNLYLHLFSMQTT